MARGKPYPPEDIERGLQALAEHGGNAAAASRQTGIPATTLRGWKTERFDEFVQVRREKRTSFIDAAWAAAEALLNHVRENVGLMKPKDAAIAFGIMVDKALVMGGEPDQISESRIKDVRSSLESKLREAVDSEPEEEVPDESD